MCPYCFVAGRINAAGQKNLTLADSTDYKAINDGYKGRDDPEHDQIRPVLSKD